MIKIQDIWKSFNGNEVLKGVDLNIERGESLTIIGCSGCGKSVLLKLIIGLLKPDKGRIIIDEVEIGESDYHTLARIRRKFGVVFQNGALFDSMTVGENVALALVEHSSLSEKEIAGRVAEALDLVGLAGTEDLSPSELSGGMRKRVGLARAIVYRPQFILYDEPTTGLDPIMAANINQMIIDLNRKLNTTSVIVTHDMVSAQKVSDRIVMLHSGKIICSGTPREIMNSEHPVVNQFVKESR
jgi:phospholipid/cholesterol/gamma-HCH transport system ATP-binding protein